MQSEDGQRRNPIDWWDLTAETWTEILRYCDYGTNAHIAIAFAFSKRYRKILRLLEPLNISDLLLLAQYSEESYKQQLKVLATSVPIKEANFSGGNPEPADWILQSSAVQKLSQNTLKRLQCYLSNYSVLLAFPCLEEITLSFNEYTAVERCYTWELSLEQAQILCRLEKLASLTFFGFTAVDLEPVTMPQLKALTLNFQTIGGQIDTQHRLTFSLPKECILDTLVVVGPEEEEPLDNDMDDDEEEGSFCMDTVLKLSVMKCCKNIRISGTSVRLYLDELPTDNDGTAVAVAARAMSMLKKWEELEIGLHKFLNSAETGSLPELLIEVDGEGLDEATLEELRDEMQKCHDRAGVQISFDYTEENALIDYRDLDESEENLQEEGNSASEDMKEAGEALENYGASLMATLRATRCRPNEI